ncbi:MAG: lamin tail domain-containing protein, partial [bacterium]
MISPYSITILAVLWLVFIPQAGAQVALSEIMFNAPVSEYTEEYIELHNNSNGWISLVGYRLGDQDEQDSLINVAGYGYMLAPGGYALVLDPGYFEGSNIYDNLIGPAALLLTISDNSFGAYGLRNNPPDTVILLTASGDTASIFMSSSDNEDGFSEEKIRLSWGDDASNWANSQNYLGTPGFVNSVQPPACDLALISLQAAPSALPWNQPVTVTAQIANLGMQASPVSALTLALSPPELNAPDSALGTLPLTEIQPAETLEVEAVFTELPAGCLKLYAWHSWADSLPENDTVQVILPGGYPAGTLIINEFLATPNTGNSEWVEIYNPGSAAVNLWGFAYSDVDTNNHRVTLGDSSLAINANGFVVIAEDSSIFELALPDSLLVVIPAANWPQLNNSGDTPYIFDAAGILQDAVPYTGWEIPYGISLER